MYALLMMMMMMCSCSHEVVSPTADSYVVGYSVNPLLALINHSCDSNYGRAWSYGNENALQGHRQGGRGRPLVKAFTTRSVAAEEEITDCYSQTFANATLEDRRAVHKRYENWFALNHTQSVYSINSRHHWFSCVMSRYLFECQCPACACDWPQRPSIDSAIRGLPSDKYLNRNKSSKDDLKRLDAMLSSSNKTKIPSNKGSHVDYWVALVKLAECTLKRPHSAHITAEEGLHQALRFAN